MEELKCDDCGIVDPDVSATFCPYAEEISGTQYPMTLCPECYHERCMDI